MGLAIAVVSGAQGLGRGRSLPSAAPERAEGQEGVIAERHHEILRAELHKTQTQMVVDGITALFEMILGESVLAKTAFLATGQGAPYQSLLGRTPRLLPQIEDVTGDARMQDGHGLDGFRHAHRLREISVGSAA